MRNQLILTLMMSFAFSNFEAGLKMFGGSAGFTLNLETDSNELYLAPKLGGFISDNFLLEGGLTYFSIELCDYNGQNCSDANDIVMSVGMKAFIDNLYVGLEYVPGIESVTRTPAGTGGIMGVQDLTDYDQEMLIWKLGTMSSIATNIYLDVALNYQTYLDSDYDHDGLVNVGVGLVYFWKD